MIPIMEQERPNILHRYRCGQCGTRFPLFSAKEKEWNYCCHCGAEIEWDKVKPIVWEEKQCSVCGKIMIRIDKDGHAYDNGNYVGLDMCWSCVMEHCVETNCLQCDIGNYPACRFLPYKKLRMERANQNET